MNTTGTYPRVHVDTAPVAATGQAGGVLLTETARATGLDTALSTALTRWRKPLAVHDPGKILLDLVISLALGGEALSDIDALRAEPELYGLVASDPTVSRLISTLAATPLAADPHGGGGRGGGGRGHDRGQHGGCGTVVCGARV